MKTAPNRTTAAAYRISDDQKAEAEGAAKSNTPAARLRARLPAVLTEVRWSRLSTQSRDDLLLALPVLLAADGATRNQALVLRVLAEAGGQLSHAELRRRLNAQAMPRVRRHEAVKRLLAAGRIEEIHQ